MSIDLLLDQEMEVISIRTEKNLITIKLKYANPPPKVPRKKTTNTATHRKTRVRANLPKTPKRKKA